MEGNKNIKCNKNLENLNSGRGHWVPRTQIAAKSGIWSRASKASAWQCRPIGSHPRSGARTPRWPVGPSHRIPFNILKNS